MNKNKSIFLNKEDAEILLHILSQYPKATFYAYGSRVSGTPHTYSDLDLCFEGDVDETELLDAFDQSNLPFRVDLHAKSSLSDDFLRHIQGHWVKIDGFRWSS